MRKTNIEPSMLLIYAFVIIFVDNESGRRMPQIAFIVLYR